MATNEQLQQLYDQIALLREQAIDQNEAQLVQDPTLGEVLDNQIDQQLAAVLAQYDAEPPPADYGLAQLVGLGPDAAPRLGAVRQPDGVAGYDDSVDRERILAVGDLYYLYQHERIGVFDVVLKLQELFTAGTVRLDSGPGAYGLYKFDRRRVLRYTRNDRHQAYRRVFGYTNTPPAPGAKPNFEFHPLFLNFMTEVAEFFRDKRVSEVIRPRATDPSFGSIAVVRRAGLDLRNNLKNASYGHINVLRVEVLQLLDEAFRILGAEDIRRLFGADNAWDVIEEVMRQHLGRPQISASQRNRMAVAGREVIRWLAQGFVLNSTRAEFEALLLEIGDRAEEWVTSAEAVGIGRRRAKGASQALPFERRGRRAAPPTVYDDGPDDNGPDDSDLDDDAGDELLLLDDRPRAAGRRRPGRGGDDGDGARSGRYVTSNGRHG